MFHLEGGFFLNKWTVTKLGDNLWNFNEQAPGTAVDAYLVCGETGAVMIDALQEAQGIYEEVRKLTDLPVQLVLTHGHFDHAGLAMEEFHQAGCPIYMNSADIPVLNGRRESGYPAGYFQELTDGQVFDLGGRTLEAMLLPGHTPGSAVLLDCAQQLAFTGDGIGSGPIWMQLPHSTSVATFEENASRLLKRLESWPNLLILPGHRNQSPEPLGIDYLRDVVETAHLVREGSLRGKSDTMPFGNEVIHFEVVQHGKMLGFFFDPAKIES